MAATANPPAPGDRPDPDVNRSGHAVDGAAHPPEDDPAVAEGDPLRFHRWMRSSPTGAVLTGVAMGLHQALVDDQPRPAYVVEAPGEPADDALFSLHFDPDDPSKTVAVMRPPARRPGTVDPPSEGGPATGQGGG